MKSILLKILILITVSVTAQNNQSVIEVNGTAEYTKTVKYYEAKVIVTQELAYSGPTIAFTELKEKYFNDLKKAGIDTSKITESKLGYLVQGYQKKGILLTYKTTSKEKFTNFLSVKTYGVQINQSNVILTLTDEQMANLSKKAIQNARAKADRIAKNINKSVVGVSKISDYNTNETSESLYIYLQDKATYNCTVKFELK